MRLLLIYLCVKYCKIKTHTHTQIETQSHRNTITLTHARFIWRHRKRLPPHAPLLLYPHAKRKRTQASRGHTHTHRYLYAARADNLHSLQPVLWKITEDRVGERMCRIHTTHSNCTQSLRIIFYLSYYVVCMYICNCSRLF